MKLRLLFNIITTYNYVYHNVLNSSLSWILNGAQTYQKRITCCLSIFNWTIYLQEKSMNNPSRMIHTKYTWNLQYCRWDCPITEYTNAYQRIHLEKRMAVLGCIVSMFIIKFKKYTVTLISNCSKRLKTFLVPNPDGES